jgi:hypothetical protein
MNILARTRLVRIWFPLNQATAPRAKSTRRNFTRKKKKRVVVVAC